MTKTDEHGGSGHNTVSKDQLLSILHRIERVREEKKDVSEDERSIFAEAKSNGFDAAAIRRLLKRREMKPHDLEEMEAIDDIYRHAVGMAKDLPLFRSVGSMAVDPTAREAVLEALKQFVPTNGEIVMTVKGQSFRLWRDEAGEAHSEPVRRDPVVLPDEKSRRDARPNRSTAEVPEVDGEGARDLGRQAARNNVPVVRNPFPWDDDRRRLWDEGWREFAGSDGMGPDDD